MALNGMLAGLAAILLPGLGAVSQHAGTMTPVEQQTVTVEMVTGTYEFRPQELRITPGTTVTWLNVSGSHTTTSETGAWNSVDRLNEGQSFSFTFQAPGEYLYYCDPHRNRGMSGKIIVAPAGG